MTAWQTAGLAALQGATEFLPISSSGHLVMFKSLLGATGKGVSSEVAVHLGTVIAVIVLFWRDLLEVVGELIYGLARIVRGAGWRKIWQESPSFRLAICLIVGTVPAAIVGLTFRHFIEGLFGNPIAAAALLFVTGEVLWLTRPHSFLSSDRQVGLGDAFWIGLAQAAAILPGISRSGTTISAGLLRDVGCEQAARYSFLLAVPVILGAAFLDLGRMSALPRQELATMIFGVAIAAICGYVALRLLMRLVRRGRLYLFAYYCWAVSLIGVAYFWATHQRG